jgi:hypothetical protein
MSEEKAVYSNAQSRQQLGEAFAGMTGEKVIISPRDCPDVPEFIRKLQLAEEATRKHSIRFG